LKRWDLLFQIFFSFYTVRRNSELWIKEFFFLILRLRSHLTYLTFTLHLVHRKPPRIALLEIDHSWDWTYPSVPQPRCHDLFDSHAETTRSHPVTEELDYLYLGWCFFSLSAFILSCCILHTDTEYQSINRDITDLNRCEYTFSANKNVNTYF
jgi:hypothetical protein